MDYKRRYLGIKNIRPRKDNLPMYAIVNQRQILSYGWFNSCHKSFSLGKVALVN